MANAGSIDQTCEPESAQWLNVTVMICTRNRSASLCETLRSMTKLHVPPMTDWELLVIDNGSIDDTACVVRDFESDLPIRCILEPDPGISVARNRGIAEARGDYVCWTDDDVTAAPDWLVAYVAAFRRHPEAAVFGGRIMPELEGPSPEWFVRCLACWPLTSVTAARDMGDAIAPITPVAGQMPWGANFAVRMREQKRHLYDPELGLSPRHRRAGEESDVIYRILMAGGTGWWVPTAIVGHRIGASRQTWKYVFAYARALGETAAYANRRSPGANWHEMPGRSGSFAMSSFELRKRMVAALVRAIAARLTGRTCDALRHWGNFGRYSGTLSYRKAATSRQPLPIGRREAC